MLFTTARIDLGLTLPELYAMTPRLFAAYLKRHRERSKRDREHAEFMIGQLTSWVANTGFRTAEKQTQPTDFMPSRWATVKDTATSPAKATPSPEALLHSLRMIFPRK